MSVVLEDRLQGLAYLIDKDDILLGQKAFCIGMSNCFFLWFRVDTNLMLEPIGEFSKPHCQSLMQQTWSIGLKLYRVIMESINTKSLNSCYKHHKTIKFVKWEWLYFSQCFAVLVVEKKGNVTLHVNHLDGSKELCKVKTKKYTLQFTTSGKISMLKTILGSMITVSARNGFLIAPKQLQAADDCLFSKQTMGASEYVNVVLPYDDNNNVESFHFVIGMSLLFLDLPSPLWPP